jgi:two-component sensor histidine kinase
LVTSGTVMREGGRPVRMLGATLDITERKKADAQRDLLVAELSHRVKNTLATVLSIAQLSFSRNAPLEKVWASFNDRIRALARTHGRLAAESWAGVPIEAILRDELAPYHDEAASNVRLGGPSLRLSPRTAVVLGMACHELATNAAKYGALSGREGKVDVSWKADSRSCRLEWVESGGPPVKRPATSGFGRLLLEKAVAVDLKGEVQLDFAPEGLRCSITFIPE